MGTPVPCSGKSPTAIACCFFQMILCVQESGGSGLLDGAQLPCLQKLPAQLILVLRTRILYSLLQLLLSPLSPLASQPDSNSSNPFTKHCYLGFKIPKAILSTQWDLCKSFQKNYSGRFPELYIISEQKRKSMSLIPGL